MTVASSGRSIGRSGVLSDGAALTMGTLILSGLAFGVTNNRCSSDGSFDVFGIGATRSSYCGTMHFPRFPNSAGGVALAFILFVIPSLTALMGTVVAVRTNGRLPLRGFAFVAGAIVLISFLLIPLAHVGFTGGP